MGRREWERSRRRSGRSRSTAYREELGNRRAAGLYKKKIGKTACRSIDNYLSVLLSLLESRLSLAAGVRRERRDRESETARGVRQRAAGVFF